jgi:surface protein
MGVIGGKRFLKNKTFRQFESFEIIVDTSRVGSANDTFVLPLPQNEIYDGPNNTTNSFPLFVAAVEPRRGTPIEYDFIVDWGDGSRDVIKAFNQSERTHVYPNVGNYKIRIKGKFGTIRFNNGGDRRKLIKILNWGDIPWQNFNDAFFGCINLNEVTNISPDLSNVVSIRNMFRACTGLTSIDLNNWNTPKITDFSSIFFDCTNIVEINASSWDVTGTNFIGNMFVRCRNLEVLDVSNWDVSNAISAFQMFYDCRKLDPQVQNWNTSNIVFARAMFLQEASRAANIDVSNWDVSSVRNNAGISTSLNGTLIDFFRLITLPTALYDQILINWSEQDLKSGVNFSAGSSKYSSNVVDARNSIVAKGWTIVDGGLQT